MLKSNKKSSLNNANKFLMKNFFKAFKWIMIIFSVFILYVMYGIYMNSSVCLTYESASLKDIEYVNLYSKVVIAYLVLVIVFIIISLKKKE